MIPSHVRDGDYLENISLSVGAEDGNDITVTVSVQQTVGQPPATFEPLVCYLATAADGLVLEPASGGVAAGARGTVGTLLTDDSVFTVTPDSNGFCDVVVTQTGSDTLFLILIKPDGTKLASAALTFTA